MTIDDVATVRRAQPSDVVRMAVLSGELGYPIAPDVLASRLQRLLVRPEDIVLISEHGGEIVGWIHGAEREFIEVGTQWEILGLVVDARCRRQGIGRRLVAEFEAWASGRGGGEVSVRSNVVRAESHPFYEREGYIRVKTQYVYRKRLTSA
jgi:GNAT superfamily N-acetyltransferase